MISLFPKPKSTHYGSVQLAEDSLYSITPWKEANSIAKIIYNQLKILTLDNRLIITDIGANVGGNTIGFWHQNFCRVNSIEISPDTAQKLKHNLAVFLLPRDSVYVNDWSVVLTLQQHVIFMDPPWIGDKDYIDQDQSKLGFGGHTLPDIVDQIFAHTDTLLVAIKVPKNYPLKLLTDQGNYCLVYPFYRVYKQTDSTTYRRTMVYKLILIHRPTASICDHNDNT